MNGDLFNLSVYNDQLNAAGTITAEFRAEPLIGVAPLTVKFYDLSTGKIKNRNWDFGDGKIYSTTKKQVEHIYDQSGNYTVNLEVSGADRSDKIIKNNYINVASIQDRLGLNCSTDGPTYACINSIYPNPAIIGDIIDFKGSGYNINNTKIIKFQWYLELNNTRHALSEKQSFSLSTQSMPAGTYNVYFMVKSSGEWSNQASQYLVINPPFSPFGINNPYTEEQNSLPDETSDLLKDLNVNWISDSILRRKVEIKPLVYDWSSVDNKIKEYKQEARSKILFIINPKSNFQHGDGRPLDNAYIPDGPQSFAAYEDYITKLIARYKSRVDIWMVFNEPADEYKISKDVYLVDDYIELLVRSFRIIKSIDPQAQIALGGIATRSPLNFYELVLTKLKDYYPEILSKLIFDVHTYSWNWQNWNRYYERGSQTDFRTFETFANLFKTFVDNPRLIVKEGATFSGRINDVVEYPFISLEEIFQTEYQQAEHLFKSRVYLASQPGVMFVQWSSLGEHGDYQGNCEDKFSSTGLVYDGTDDKCGLKNDPYDGGKGVKKLGYYTLKYLIKQSQGSSIKKLETDIPNIFLYHIERNNKSVYVAWWDYFAEGENDETKKITITLPNLNASKATIIKAIPDFRYNFQTSNKKLRPSEYPRFFNSSQTPVVDRNTITITLDKAPVYIEKQE